MLKDGEDGLAFVLVLEQLGEDGNLGFSITRSDANISKEDYPETSIANYGDLITVDYESPSIKKFSCRFRIDKIE